MGQAKNRGSKDERIREAHEKRELFLQTLGMEKYDLGEIKKDLGLPASAIFHGYAVHIPESDEFLAQSSEDTFRSGRQWAKKPELAQYHPAFDIAYKLARHDRGEIVVGIFETETHYFSHPLT